MTDCIAQRREERKTALYEQHEVAHHQWLSTVDEAQKKVLQRRLTVLEQQIAACEAQPRELALTAAAAPRPQAPIEKHLFKIDFDEARAIFQHMLREFHNDSGTALLVVEHSGRMCGELCLDLLRDLLANETRNLREFTVDVARVEELNACGVFNRLGGYFNLPPRARDDLTHYARQLCATIGDLARNGDILLLKFLQWDSLARFQAMALQQFVDLFWQPLLRLLPTLPEHARRVRVIAVVTAHLRLDPQCRAGEPPSVLTPIPLRNWRCDEIERWLRRFTSVDDGQIPALAHEIYSDNDCGIPHFVADTLRARFN